MCTVHVGMCAQYVYNLWQILAIFSFYSISLPLSSSSLCKMDRTTFQFLVGPGIYPHSAWVRVRIILSKALVLQYVGLGT